MYAYAMFELTIRNIISGTYFTTRSKNVLHFYICLVYKNVCYSVIDMILRENLAMKRPIYQKSHEFVKKGFVYT